MSDYDDIINLPHYEPKNHVRMSLYKRAAQFAPFAALTGYGDAVEEAARFTDRGVELTEEEKDRINQKLMFLQSGIEKRPEITISYFKPDDKKAGGSYVTATGKLKKIDQTTGQIILENGLRIPVKDIYDCNW